jgi:hypothetical protein
MGRNTREIRGWTEEKVEGCAVAPHRYLWSRQGAEDDLAEPGSSRIAEWKAALPYQRGEVIWVANGGRISAIRARILDIIVDYDRYGDRRPIYQCQTETAKGVWSKVWSRFYPGAVQRGYHLAGLAPDLDGMLD